MTGWFGILEWGRFALLRPGWLLVLPVVALLAWRATRGGRLGDWSRAIDPSLLAAMERFGRLIPGTGRTRWLPAAIAALLVLALAGPARRDTTLPAFRNLDGILVLLDLSSSITRGGALPSALSAARLAAEAGSGRPVALIIFAGDAYLASPFTTDAGAVGTTIAALDDETVPEAGSCLDCALRLAVRTLDDSRTLASDVILVSDGGGLGAPPEETRSLRERGARLSTLYVAPRERPSDMPAPDPDALAALASAGGGWDGLAAHPADLLDSIAAKPASGALAAELAPLTFRDYGPWLAALPLLLSLGLFRRSA